MSISSDVYDREYFESDRCEGWERFRADRGLSALKARELELLDVGTGQSVLDAGCGRGEVLLACAGLGATVAGIDYAEAAVALSLATLADVPGADVRRGDVSALPWPDSRFDRILFGDVIEHLEPESALAALRECRRVLAPGGKLVIHTAPNLWFLRLGWPLSRVGLRVAGHGETVRRVDAWINESRRYHVNEQSQRSLRGALRETGFERSLVWIDPNVVRDSDHHLTRDVRSIRGLTPIARVAGSRPLRTIFGNDVYAVARRSSGS